MIYIYIIFVFIFSVFISILVGIYNGFNRINEVYKFRKQILDLSGDWTRRELTKRYIEYDEILYHYYKLPPYKDMVNSKKPIKLETYFNEKEIRELLDCEL